jgi:hypothetical protein
MDYSKQLSDLRNGIHCDIVQEATVRNCINGNFNRGVLLFEDPIKIKDYVISSICCETGLLISDDNDRIIPYQKLTVEELSVIHSYVVGEKKYSFTPDKQLV